MNYNLLVTGDCQSNSTGAISLSINGGGGIYTVQWTLQTTPPTSLGTDTITSGPSIRTSLSSGEYLATVNDNTLPLNQTLIISIPVSSGVCATSTTFVPLVCEHPKESVTVTE